MLKHLLVKNFVLIDECSLDFEAGFSAFTGETGAGKSLLIDAMCLLAGERASSSYIKQDAKFAVVEGSFDISCNLKVKKILNEAGYGDLNQVVFRREMNRDGKSTVSINGKGTTLNLMKECVQHEIDIHSQHDTQYLLNKASQLALLDQLVQDKECIEQTTKSYNEYAKVRHEFEVACNTTYNENDLEFIQMEIEEIEKAALKPMEEAQLEEKQKEFQQFEKAFHSINGAIAILDDNEGANEKLYSALHILGYVDNPKLQKLHAQMLEHYNEIVDVTEQLKDYVESMDVSEEKMNELQSRLFEIQRLKRKYGPTIEAIQKRQEEMRQQVLLIHNRQQYMEQMEANLNRLYEQFLSHARKLSDLRKKVAQDLQQQIEMHCHDLMLPNTQFVVDFQLSDGNAHGVDDIEFYISMNVGELPRSLARVASGGELSRLMLALKIIFTRLEGIQTVIFDEIDTGVSGAVASSIGLKMATLSSDAQVFSVTHLAQVAACAKNHYLVKKDIREQKTVTEVVKLDKQARIEQLALISSGNTTEVGLAAAHELYITSQKNVIT